VRRALPLVLVLALGCVAPARLARPPVQLASAEVITSPLRLGGPEASEPVASLGTWVPAQVATKTLLAQADPKSRGDFSGLSVRAGSFIAGGTSGNGFGLNNTAANSFGMSFSGANMLLRGNGTGGGVWLGDGVVWFLQCDYTGCLGGKTMVSNIASGANGYALAVDGARMDLGTGANDYLKSNGTSVILADGNSGQFIGRGYGLLSNVPETQGLWASGSDMILNVAAAYNIRMRANDGTQWLTLGASEVRTGSASYLASGVSGAGAPTAGDCDADAERGRIYIDTSSNRLYVCNGATRGWDYAALTD